jgi:glycosyltransferase involved in cell wall biosynthesis
MTNRKLKVIVVGPLPPPINGMTRMTEIVLRSSLASEAGIKHVDISDHRSIGRVARVELTNVVLALWHGILFSTVLIRHRPDIVYLPIARDRLGFLRDLLFLLPSRLLQKRVVVHLHSRDFWRFYSGENGWLRWLIRVALAGDVTAIVLGETLRGAFGHLLPAERVHVVRNGIPDIGAGAHPSERQPVVLHLATLCREKGVFDLIAAAEQLCRRVPGARFVLAGDWYDEGERQDAVARIAASGAEDRFELTGTVDGEAKADLLRSAAVMAFPTSYRYEAQPLVLIEALSAGTPVVATRLGAIPEIVEDGIEGYLVDRDDIAALVERLERVLTDLDLRTRMGYAARARYIREFTAERFAATLRQVWMTSLRS